MEDIKIIELFNLRDEQAISETDIKYGMNCRRIARDILSDREDAEECVDDTYLALWNAIPPQCPMNYPAFIYRILRNLGINRLHKHMAQKRGGGELPLVLHELEGVLSSDDTPERSYEAKELIREINRFLAKLSKDDRAIFLGRYWLFLPTAEIGKRLCFSDAKVRTSLHRSRKRLHIHLSEEGFI